MNKRITLIILLIFAIMTLSINPAFGQEINAKAFNDKILFNKIEVKLEAYNINGNNYFKLRDLAMILKDSEKKFQVKWDEKSKQIILNIGMSYSPVGGELITNKKLKAQKVSKSSDTLIVKAKEVSLDAYNIDGNNYFKLRDIGKLIDFSVDWNEDTRTIEISTFQSYNKKESVFKDFHGKWSRDEKEVYEFSEDGTWKLESSWGDFEGSLRDSKIKEDFYIMIGKGEEKLDEGEIEEPVYMKVILKDEDDKYKEEFKNHEKILLGISEYEEMILFPIK